MSADTTVPPNDKDAEEALLGAALITPGIITEVEDIIASSDFYVERHGWIWDAMQRVRSRGLTVDVVTVSAALGSRLDAAGGTSYLTHLLTRPASSLHALSYAHVVAEMSLRRKMLRGASEIAKQAYDTSKPFDDVLADAETIVFDIAKKSVGGGDFTPASTLISSLMDKLEAGTSDGGLSTGLAALDRLFRLRPADLIVVAGRPGKGKTALLLEIARHAAVSERIPTAVFSLEMPEESLLERIISQTSGIPLSRIRNRSLSQHDWRLFAEAAGAIAESPLFINDAPALSPVSIRSQCLRLASQHPIGLVVIDYLQLMSGSRRYQKRVEEVSEISRSLKLLARELNVPVLAAAQLSRAVEQRQDKRPMLSDLRESGSIEQDSDIVMFVYGEDDSTRFVSVEKHRNGPVGTTQLTYTGSTVHFSSSKERP